MTVKFGQRVYINFLIAGKRDNAHWNMDEPKPPLEFNWWSWLPHFNWNHGSPFRSEVFDGGVSFLCFCVTFTLWPAWVKKQNAAYQAIGSANNLR
jgi:hypothetical protein